MCGACTVLVQCIYGGNTPIVWCMCGACVIYVQCIHDQEYSKEEQQTGEMGKKMSVILSNRKAAWMNTMVLKATLF